MLPLPMNEFVQENLREVGIDVELVPIEWNTLTQRGCARAYASRATPVGAMNVSYQLCRSPSAPSCASSTVPLCRQSAPTVMPYINPEVDRLIEAAEASSTPTSKTEILAKAA